MDRHLTPSNGLRLPGNRTVSAPVVGTGSRAEVLRRSAAARAELLGRPRPGPDADRLPITAVIAAYNEGDIIRLVVEDLIEQGVDVVLIDHRSTDDTVEQVAPLLGRGLLWVETFPDDAAIAAEVDPEVYAWRYLLARKEQIVRDLGWGWYLHQDADEFRESPWPATTLREGIERAHREGANAINFCVLDFVPTDDRPLPSGGDPRRQLQHHETSIHPMNHVQVKGWCHVPGRRFSLWRSGGHEVEFDGRDIHPVRFLLRHYPVRSQEHGLRKVFQDRKNRWDETERDASWHQQYDHIVSDEHRFVRPVAELVRYDPDATREALLAGRDPRVPATASSGTPASEPSTPDPAPADAPGSPGAAPATGYHDHPRPEVQRLVPETARRVLDVGCGAGTMGAGISERLGAEVWGVETDLTAANVARSRLHLVLPTSIESALGTLPDGYFDAVVFADVLEHVADPDQVLAGALAKLAPGGVVVASIPNVRHWSVLGPLLQGRWDYADAGILDRTHLRFFTRATIIELFAGHGLAISELSPVRWEWPGIPPAFVPGLERMGLSVETLGDELVTYQYLIVAAPADSAGFTTSWTERPVEIRSA